MDVRGAIPSRSAVDDVALYGDEGQEVQFESESELYQTADDVFHLLIDQAHVLDNTAALDYRATELLRGASAGEMVRFAKLVRASTDYVRQLFHTCVTNGGVSDAMGSLRSDLSEVLAKGEADGRSAALLDSSEVLLGGFYEMFDHIDLEWLYDRIVILCNAVERRVFKASGVEI